MSYLRDRFLAVLKQCELAVTLNPMRMNEWEPISLARQDACIVIGGRLLMMKKPTKGDR
jgi:hypothetical protein